MDDLKKKIITIAGTSAIKKKDTNEILGLKIEDEKKIEYTMWFTKKDGNPTAASVAFKAQQMGIGSKVGIGYAEEERTYDYKDKKTGEKRTGKSTNRTIRFFSEADNIESFDEESYGKNIEIQTVKKVDEIPEIDEKDLPF